MEYNGRYNTYKLTSGKEISANCGILGITDNDGTPVISDGYDGSVYGQNNLSKQDRREVADYIINLWNKWVESEE